MKKLIFILAFICVSIVQAQDVTYVDGLAFKSFTTVELDAISNKVEGDTYYDTNKKQLVFWNGTMWASGSGADATAVRVNTSSPRQWIGAAVGTSAELDAATEASILSDTPVNGVTLIIEEDEGDTATDYYIDDLDLSVAGNVLNITTEYTGLPSKSYNVTLPSGGGSATTDASDLTTGTLNDDRLSTAVQNSLSLANSALQSFTETPQTLGISGSTLSLSNGGGSVTLPTSSVNQTTGTFTPTLVGSTGGSATLSGVGSYAVGSYTKTGNVIEWVINATVTSVSGTLTGNLNININISGETLAANKRMPIDVGLFSMSSGATDFTSIYGMCYSTGNSVNGGSWVDFYYRDSAGKATVLYPATGIAVGSQFCISGTFITQ